MANNVVINIENLHIIPSEVPDILSHIELMEIDKKQSDIESIVRMLDIIDKGRMDPSNNNRDSYDLVQKYLNNLLEIHVNGNLIIYRPGIICLESHIIPLLECTVDLFEKSRIDPGYSISF